MDRLERGLARRTAHAPGGAVHRPGQLQDHQRRWDTTSATRCWCRWRRAWPRPGARATWPAWAATSSRAARHLRGATRSAGHDPHPRRSLAEPYQLEGGCSISASIGVALFPGGRHHAGRADQTPTAPCTRPGAGPQPPSSSAPAGRAAAAALAHRGGLRDAIAADALRRAATDGRHRSAPSGRRRGLVRWHDAELGPISPASSSPIAGPAA